MTIDGSHKQEDQLVGVFHQETLLQLTQSEKSSNLACEGKYLENSLHSDGQILNLCWYNYDQAFVAW